MHFYKLFYKLFITPYSPDSVINRSITFHQPDLRGKRNEREMRSKCIYLINSSYVLIDISTSSTCFLLSTITARTKKKRGKKGKSNRGEKM